MSRKPVVIVAKTSASQEQEVYSYVSWQLVQWPGSIEGLRLQTESNDLKVITFLEVCITVEQHRSMYTPGPRHTSTLQTRRTGPRKVLLFQDTEAD